MVGSTLGVRRVCDGLCAAFTCVYIQPDNKSCLCIFGEHIDENTHPLSGYSPSDANALSGHPTLQLAQLSLRAPLYHSGTLSASDACLPMNVSDVNEALPM